MKRKQTQVEAISFLHEQQCIQYFNCALMWWSLRFLLLLSIAMSSFFSPISSVICRDTVPSADSLDSIVRDHAFDVAMNRPAGVVYQVPLPANLLGIEVAVVKLSGYSFWKNGVNINSIRIPPKTILVPPVRRLAIVYQNLGNLSSCYYNVLNSTAATPVVGLLAYNVNSNSTMPMNFLISNEPISVEFPYVTLPPVLNSSLIKCVRFGLNGSMILGRGWQGCSTMSAGHFMMVYPSSKAISPPLRPTVKENGKRKIWIVSAIAFGCGVVGGVLLVLVGATISRSVKRKRMQEMERQSEEGVVLEKVWVGGSKMPSASMVRTQPVLENGSSP